MRCLFGFGPQPVLFVPLPQTENEVFHFASSFANTNVDLHQMMTEEMMTAVAAELEAEAEEAKEATSGDVEMT